MVHKTVLRVLIVTQRPEALGRVLGGDRCYRFVEPEALGAGVAEDGEPPDCIVLDYASLGDAASLLEAVSGETGPPYPIVALFSDELDWGACLRAGVQEFVDLRRAGPETLPRAVALARERFALARALGEKQRCLARWNRDLARRVRELQRIFDTAPIGLAIAEGPDGRHMRGNPFHERTLGLPGGSELSKTAPTPAPYRILRDGRELAVEELPMQRACRGETVTGEIVDVERTDGERIVLYCHAGPLVDDSGQCLGAVGAFLDISELRRTQERLRESEERFRSLVEQAVDGIFSADAAGRYLEANSAGAAMLGYTREEILSLRLTDTVAPEEKARIAPALAKLVGGATVRGEWRFRRKDGSFFIGEAVGCQSPGGRLQFIVRDVTERRLIEAKLRDQTERLREADRRKDEFLAMLAHELRNPLAPIRNAVQVLRHASLDGAQFQWCRDVIERQVGQLARLVDDLLDVSRITRGKIELHMEPVEVATLLQRAVETSRPLIEARRHHLSVQMPGEPLVVEGDLVRLVQVLSNLLNNAAKYTEEGGRISLVAERADHSVMIRVRDTGRGIEPAVLPSLFDLFFQVDQNLDRADGGLGIGLSLVQRLVRMHGGRVAAYSEGRGRGSEFTVWLPLWEASRSERTEPPVDSDVRGLRVLVADPQVEAAEGLAQRLEILGYRVRTARDGPAALAAAAVFRPQAIVLDLALPGMDSYEVARRLRVRPETRDTLLIAVTGEVATESARRFRSDGFDRHFSKPVDLAALKVTLETFAFREVREPDGRCSSS
ncbi:PAS domain-containing hybrid sensor histidine kinase/response regulator [Candidatus Methylocalor cossyra]|uniref:PAS domain-containing hybrid sensor histidine kinase/response regulator n=1 Tax=Candidatus Methylocalor cossyra TaxID=3108543 RepID=UPI0032B1E159